MQSQMNKAAPVYCHQRGQGRLISTSSLLSHACKVECHHDRLYDVHRECALQPHTTQDRAPSAVACQLRNGSPLQRQSPVQHHLKLRTFSVPHRFQQELLTVTYPFANMVAMAGCKAADYNAQHTLYLGTLKGLGLYKAPNGPFAKRCFTEVDDDLETEGASRVPSVVEP